ncbi:hypothetical protein [Fusibacter ferrireducens]|uniref:HEAT repeat domain-containing protein n=1 Tax=Fusibacter ferrireducens TaxID=2785058 RepID=A0ABR9ZMW6_9FIRM|nr:hypothetical protein [Fusibacter ferrireducens]MBF4691805.1 hypothetical protein [Fusibacter ferrireducens]
MKDQYTIEYLMTNSNLPGPRGNLELLYKFAHTASEEISNECLDYNRDDLSNSPEEFVVMCGVVSFCVRQTHLFIIDDADSERLGKMEIELKKYANHSSWRIREAVAIGLQEVAKSGGVMPVIHFLKKWCTGTALEKRALVATLCEPALLKDQEMNSIVLDYLLSVTHPFEQITRSLTDGEKSLRKALAYGWSVAIVASPEMGKRYFEALAKIENKHIRWVLKENLKKNRLVKIESEWVEMMLLSFQIDAR